MYAYKQCKHPRIVVFDPDYLNTLLVGCLGNKPCLLAQIMHLSDRSWSRLSDTKRHHSLTFRSICRDMMELMISLLSCLMKQAKKVKKSLQFNIVFQRYNYRFEYLIPQLNRKLTEKSVDDCLKWRWYWFTRSVLKVSIIYTTYEEVKVLSINNRYALRKVSHKIITWL